MFSALLLISVQSISPIGPPVPETLRPARSSRALTLSELRFNECIDLALDDPKAAIGDAIRWRTEGGKYLAQHCLGFAYAEQFQWAAATKAFVDAAQEAEVAKDFRTARFWVQAGNAALAGGQADAALAHLSAALVQGTLTGQEKGEAHLDLARVHVARKDYAAAKREFDLVHKLVPEDPLGWLLSATLARREGQLERAKADIGVAAKLAPKDADIALETGNIAYQGGDVAGAKLNWEQAIAIKDNGLAARQARQYLTQLEQDQAVPER